MRNIYGETIQDLEKYFESIGEKKFKAMQVYEWLYEKKATSFDEFSNLKKEVREQLKKDYCLDKLEIIDIRKTSYDPIAKIIRKMVKDEHITSKVMVICSNPKHKQVQG